MPASLSSTVDVLRPPPVPDRDRMFLLLDFDGTIVPLAERPDAVVADLSLRELLGRVSTRLEGRVGIVSGRSLEQLDAMLGSAAQGLMVAGSHGAEHRVPGAAHRTPSRPAALDEAERRFAAFAATHPGVLVEVKTLGVGLHYRGAPDAADAAAALGDEAAAALDLTLQRGKMMVELRAPGDKGDAVRRLAAESGLTATTPFFLGDDVTDEDGFLAAAALGGAGVLVGPPRPTAADYHLPDVEAVHRWLEEVAA